MDKNTILNMINKSGNDFHSSVSKKLEQLGWSVLDCHYYNDPDSNKAREIDIIASREYPVNGHKIIFKLFIECKYINSPLILWFREKNINNAKACAKDNTILRHHPDFYLNSREVHHYINNNLVAFKWTQNNNFDLLYDAQHKVLKAMTFFSEDNIYEIRYPVIIVNDFKQLMKRDDSEDGATEINTNFQIEINYSYKDKGGLDISKYFLVDVVSEPLLNLFIENLEKNDIALFCGNLRWDLDYKPRHRLDQSNHNKYI